MIAFEQTVWKEMYCLFYHENEKYIDKTKSEKIKSTGRRIEFDEARYSQTELDPGNEVLTVIKRRLKTNRK